VTGVRPLFLFGIARSGTNLLAGMLNARRDVHIALDPLMPYFNSLQTALASRCGDAAVAERFAGGAVFQDGYFDPAVRALLDVVLSGELKLALSSALSAELVHRISVRAALESPALAAALVAARGATFDELLRDILDGIGAHSGEALAWCGSKEVWTTDFVPLLARALPEARFILIRRDPRAILASLIAMMRSDPSQAAHTVSYMRHWRKEVALGHAFADAAALKNRLLIVRYEELAAAGEANARRLCAFLELPFDQSMLTPVAVDGAVSFGNSSFEAMRGIAATSIERWRAKLDSATTRTIECHCGPEMLTDGYELTNTAPVWPDATVEQFVREAHASPGSWRSDSGDTRADLAHEARRWDMMGGRASPSNAEIRTHFLFASVFEKLRKFSVNRNVAVAAQG
jgi:hypothetical protein